MFRQMSFSRSTILLRCCSNQLRPSHILINKLSTTISCNSSQSGGRQQENGTSKGQQNNISIDVESLRKCQLEFNSGAGGVEAACFATELYEMYRLFAARNDWIWQPLVFDTLKATNGLRFAAVSVDGDWCYAKLRFEGGVHRVQRTPVTDKSRIHTSTASLAVLPEPDKPEIMFAPGDIKMEIMRASGPGGMNVNACSTAVRLVHIPTGVVVKTQDARYLHVNEQLARKRLAAILLKRQVDEMNRQYSGSRKLQVGSLDRADKIRTYNFKEDRITDHRLKKSFHGIQEFLEGGEKLEQMIDMLMEMYEEEGAAAEEGQKKGRREEETTTANGSREMKK